MSLEFPTSYWLQATCAFASATPSSTSHWPQATCASSMLPLPPTPSKTYTSVDMLHVNKRKEKVGEMGMRHKNITIVGIALLVLAAVGLWVVAPLLGPSPVDQAWDALYLTTRGIVEYRQANGTWPSSLAAVTNAVPAAYQGTTFVYDPVKLTIGLPAEFENNPLRLVSRGRLGGSKTVRDLVVHIAAWAETNGLDIAATAPES